MTAECCRCCHLNSTDCLHCRRCGAALLWVALSSAPTTYAGGPRAARRRRLLPPAALFRDPADPSDGSTRRARRKGASDPTKGHR